MQRIVFNGHGEGKFISRLSACGLQTVASRIHLNPRTEFDMMAYVNPGTIEYGHIKIEIDVVS